MDDADNSIRAVIKENFDELHRQKKAQAVTTPTWSLPEAASWVAWKHTEHLPLYIQDGLDRIVALEAARLGDGTARSELIDAVGRAENALIQKLADASLRAFAIAPLNGTSAAISPDDWPLLSLSRQRNAAYLGSSPTFAYVDITVMRENVLRLWPADEVHSSSQVKHSSAAGRTRYEQEVIQAAIQFPDAPERRDDWLEIGMKEFHMSKRLARKGWDAAIEAAKGQQPNTKWGSSGAGKLPARSHKTESVQ